MQSRSSKPTADLVEFTPSKKFFVSMMTRDIDLKDSILDLLDNCLDGILRQISESPQLESALPYDGYWAKIEATPEHFSIEDNCGGIPRNVAINGAFRLGTIDVSKDANIPTVGMYGIGMKRAIFKMGQGCRVESKTEKDSYFVNITPEWLKDDTSWVLDLNDGDTDLKQSGTKIYITKLYDEIKRRFDAKNDNFVVDLGKEISSFHALIIKKGFRVSLNGKVIEPTILDILVPTNFDSQSVPPYAYKGVVDGVEIKLLVGFYRKLATEGELDDEKKLKRSRDNAGWTVICNDRVVLHKDTSHVTGWGDSPVPKYHNQFISIAGVVYFNSNDSFKLPLNTTKRGLDMQSQAYWQARKFMKIGLKKYTDFTNSWKGRERETDSSFENSSSMDILEAIAKIPVANWKGVASGEGSSYSPALPKPQIDVDMVRVSYVRAPAQVTLLSQFLFGLPSAKPKEVGEECFDRLLKSAIKEG